MAVPARPMARWGRAAAVAVATTFACGPVPAAHTQPAASATAPTGVFVPSLWDPGAPLEKPGLPEGQTIRILTEDDYPPFGFTLPDGTLGGFNVDLARALCDELRVACTVQARRFDTIIPALKAGAGDAAIASIAITERTLRDVDFTAPYYRSPARFVARAEDAFDAVLPETIGKRKVGVERGTAHAAFLDAFFRQATVRAFGSASEVRSALRSGAIDLAFGDGITLAQWLNGAEGAACCRFVGGPFLESRFFGDGAGIAVRKTDGRLRAALDYALARLAAKGVYADLYLKHFPIGVY